jgi:hypothetical protein
MHCETRIFYLLSREDGASEQKESHFAGFPLLKWLSYMSDA